MSIIPRPVPLLEPSPTHGYVYIIKSDSGHYKIGKSVRPDKRVGEFTLQLPFKIEIIHLVECDDYHFAERLFHTMCSKFHVNGEWFALPDEAVTHLKLWGTVTREDIDYFSKEDLTLLPHILDVVMYGKEAWELAHPNGIEGAS